MKHWSIRTILAILLIGCLAVPCFAAEQPDLSRECSLTVTVKTASGKAISGGKVDIYLVAEAAFEEPDYMLLLTEEFADSGMDVSAISEFTAQENRDHAAALLRYADSPLQSGEPNAQGKVKFTGLRPGLYLVNQSKAKKGYTALAPFLVSVPRSTEDGWSYNVDAAPKAGTAETVPPTTKPPTRPTKPSGNLPQTGQLWWPVYLLGGCGLALFLLGIYRRRHNHA